MLPPVLVHHPHVSVDPNVLGGSPIIEGTRIPVRRVWDWHRKGATVETLLRRYPALTPAHVLSALAFAYDNQDVVTADIEREQMAMVTQ